MKIHPAGWLLLGIAVAGGGTYFAMSGNLTKTMSQLSEVLAMLSEKTKQVDSANVKIDSLEKQIIGRNSTLLGFTEYRTYLTAGKQSLAEQTKLITATVKRDEGFTRFLTESFFGIPSHGAVEVTYAVEYSFGYDLRSSSYDIRQSTSGIEVVVGSPALVATPAVTNLKSRVMTGGVFTDENAAIIKLQQDAATRALAQGKTMALRPEIKALCEKQLTGFLYDFLAKQPGVKAVPHITVVYK